MAQETMTITVGTVCVSEEDWMEAERLAARALELSHEYGFILWRGSTPVVQSRPCPPLLFQQLPLAMSLHMRTP